MRLLLLTILLFLSCSKEPQCSSCDTYLTIYKPDGQIEKTELINTLDVNDCNLNGTIEAANNTISQQALDAGFTAEIEYICD